MPLPAKAEQVDLVTPKSVEGECEHEGDLREHSKSKSSDGVERHFAVVVVQTTDGSPVTHEVFKGNISEYGPCGGSSSGLKSGSRSDGRCSLRMVR